MEKVKIGNIFCFIWNILILFSLKYLLSSPVCLYEFCQIVKLIGCLVKIKCKFSKDISKTLLLKNHKWDKSGSLHNILLP